MRKPWFRGERCKRNELQRNRREQTEVWPPPFSFFLSLDEEEETEKSGEEEIEENGEEENGRVCD